MTQVVTLRELSSRAGVEIDRLQHMIRIGSLPEANRVSTDDGEVWVVPIEALPDLADRTGWHIDTVDLTSNPGPTVWVSPAQPDLDLPESAGSVATLEAGDATDPVGHDLVPRSGDVLTGPGEFTRSDEEVTVAEIIDGALLSRLLGAHEDRAEANARARESQRAMTAMAAGQQRMVRELAEERYERQRVNDRFRDERNARMVADAKLAEVRARLDHETAMVEKERQARLDANRRIAEAEREAAAALASMSWLARRKLQRRLGLLETGEQGS